MNLFDFYYKQIEINEINRQYCIDKYFKTNDIEWLENANDWNRSLTEWENMAREEGIYVLGIIE